MIRGGSWETRKNASELREWIYRTVAMAKGVTAINRPTADSIEIRSESLPVWTIVLAILLFPIGLLFLLAKDRAVMVVRVTDGPGTGSTVSVSGRGSPMLVSAMTYVYDTTHADPSEPA
jgi:hypothetical protein